MPRPNMATQRREEILDAFEACILQGSIQETSLEALAHQAKMKRSILRHYIGNKDDIICALSERWLNRYDNQWQETLEYLDRVKDIKTTTQQKHATARLLTLIDILFAERDRHYVNGTLIGEAIFSQAKRLPQVKSHIQQAKVRFMEILENELRQVFKQTNALKIHQVATGIYANYLLSESLLPLDLLDDIHTLKDASLLLIKTLKP